MERNCYPSGASLVVPMDGVNKWRRHGREDGSIIRAEGVAALYEALRARPDVTVIHPLHRQPYSETEFEIRDPNGYVLVFAERL